MLKRGKQVIVAIDYGTSESGFAYAFPSDDKELEIQCPELWAGLGQIARIKTPSVLLIDYKTHEYLSFGYEALQTYSEQLQNAYDRACDEIGENDDLQMLNIRAKEIHEKHNGLLFKNFKMQLYEEDDAKTHTINIPDKLKSECGRELDTEIVFSESIRFMKDQAIAHLRRVDRTIKDSQILWVLTVPGMGNAASKSFMRSAAERAGLGVGDDIVIALEPEAASLEVREEYYQECARNKAFTKLEIGDKYLIVDCGGGTVDFACHQVLEKSVLETHSATGVCFGSTYLDKYFYELCDEILGNFDDFKELSPVAWEDLQKNWTTKKLEIKCFEGKRRVAIPEGMRDYYTKDYLKKEVTNYKEHGNDVSYSRGICLGPEVIKYIFHHVLTGISKKIEELLEDKRVADSKFLFLVGGFGGSNVLFDHLQSKFEGRLNLFVPTNPMSSVMKGAVRFGAKPESIHARRMQFTYGFATSDHFDEKHDHEALKFYDDKGTSFCSDRFCVVAKKEALIPKDRTECIYSIPVSFKDKRVEYRVFASTIDEPRYVTDNSCSLLSTLTVHYPKTLPYSLQARMVKLEFKFGDTEIKITATRVKDGGQCSVDVQYNKNGQLA